VKPERGTVRSRFWRHLSIDVPPDQNDKKENKNVMI